jgi:hypothetical protein
MNDDTHGIQTKLEEMKKLLSELDATILDAKMKDYLIGLAKSWVSDADYFINEGRAGAASLVLGMVEQQLTKAKKLVAEFGPNIQMVG